MNYLYQVQHFLPLLDSQVSSEFPEIYSGATSTPSNITLIFSQELTVEQKSQLDSIVSSHSLTYTSDFNYLMSATEKTQEENITFGRSLLHDFMRKNILEGMSIKQSLWVFARFEEFQVSCDFGSKRVDLFKMFQSGAIPTVYFCLLQVQPDPMTEPHHWLTQERLDWVSQKVSEYIGPQMTAYIESL